MDLPTNLYERFVELFDKTPGWFYHESAAIWDTLLNYQEATNNMGNMLEIGVFQGKSAGTLALHRRGEETCVLGRRFAASPGAPKDRAVCARC